MRTLHRKLLRDLGRLKGQATAIGVVVAAGVMVLVLSVTTLDSLQATQERFYQEHAYAEVFADLKRAPEHLRERLAAVPGVDRLETRVRAPVRLDLDGFDDPVRGTVLSTPETDGLNRLYLRVGRLPEPGRIGEVVIGEPFAEAHGLVPGDRLEAIIEGRRETLTVVGIGLSPEFVYQVAPADLLPDYERYTVMWMHRRGLAEAVGMDGAFNNLVATLQPGASRPEVMDALDRLLDAYGGVGAQDRDDQISHRFFEEELDQMRAMAVVLPAIFLGVAAFLLSVLVGRIIRTQRQQIAVLKAFGYRDTEIGLHYGLFTAVVALAGAVVGIAAGAWSADGLAAVYAEYFRFPELEFRMRPSAILLGLLVAGLAAALGTFRAVRGAVRLPPAESMRPPMPEQFSHGWLERSLVGRHLDQATRIIIRNLARHRFKASFSVLGIALSGALLLVGSYQFGSVDELLDIQYRKVMKMDYHLVFTNPTSERSLGELRTLPGVRYVEGYRGVPVRLEHGTREYRTSITGMEPEPELRALIDAAHRPVGLPAEGLVMTDYLAEYLDLEPGDTVRAEVMEGSRRTVEVELAAVLGEPLGVGAYMERRALNRVMGEGPAVTGAWVLGDRAEERALFDRLWEVPRVAAIGQVGDAERHFREYIEDTVLVVMGILLLMAGSIAFAVVYNNARIAFEERARELATLRVLGYSRPELAWILIGELAVLVLLAIPLGWLVGTGFAVLINYAMSIEMYRLPLVITPQTYAFSAVGVLVAATLSVLLIMRRLYRLDMVSVLKSAE